ncbi:MAG: hypothetical protein Q9183_000435 [Haloplaca sp. 2 TL-2023]
MLESSQTVVWITPLINRSEEGDVPELGAGGGGGDLVQTHELELSDLQAYQKLMEICRTQIQNDKLLAATLGLIRKPLDSRKTSVSFNIRDASMDNGDMPLEKLAWLLSRVAQEEDGLQDLKKSSFPGALRIAS